MTEPTSLSIERNGEIVVAAVSGEIDFSVADDFGRRILEWISNEDAALVLDLTTLSYTDSAGINLVFDLATRLREHDQAFRIVLPVNSQPWRTFLIAGIQTEMPVFETLEEAVARHEIAPRAVDRSPGTPDVVPPTRVSDSRRRRSGPDRWRGATDTNQRPRAPR